MENQILTGPSEPSTHSMPTREEYLQQSTSLSRKGKPDTRCIICQVEYLEEGEAEGERVIQLQPCLHEFHQVCYTAFHSTCHANRNQCPLCRIVLFAAPALSPEQAGQAEREEDEYARALWALDDDDESFTDEEGAEAQQRTLYPWELLEWIMDEADASFRRQCDADTSLEVVPWDVLARYNLYHRGHFVNEEHEGEGDLWLRFTVASRNVMNINMAHLENTSKGRDAIAQHDRWHNEYYGTDGDGNQGNIGSDGDEERIRQTLRDRQLSSLVNANTVHAVEEQRPPVMRPSVSDTPLYQDRVSSLHTPSEASRSNQLVPLDELNEARDHYFQLYEIIAEMVQVHRVQRERDGHFSVENRSGDTVSFVHNAQRYVELYPGYVIFFRDRRVMES